MLWQEERQKAAEAKKRLEEEEADAAEMVANVLGTEKMWCACTPRD